MTLKKPKLKPIVEKDQREKLIVKKSVAGLGLFATAPIKKDTFIIEYKGPLLTQEQADNKGGQYLFALGKTWTIDGNGRQNMARYINHSCVRTNCQPVQYAMRMKIRATRNIKAGEELLYDYGKEFFDEYIGKHCRCYKHSAKTRKAINAFKKQRSK